MTTLHLRNSIGRSPWRGAFLLMPLVLACFALLPRAQAASPELLPAPAPDGAYTGFNTAEGLNALHNLSTGQFDTALGFNTLRLNTTGSHNTAVGAQALLNNNGDFNTAVGENALVHNTMGTLNTAVGQGALANNIDGVQNTATGFQALVHNTGGSENTAIGWGALSSNTLGGNLDGGNTAIGFLALANNKEGGGNTAIGRVALFSNTDSDNTAIGRGALEHNTTGFGNTAIGTDALSGNTTGNGNIALGDGAGGGPAGNDNIAIGIGTLHSSGSNNIALGTDAGDNLTTGSSNIDIGNEGVGGESNTIRIGFVQTRTFIAGIRGKTTRFANAIPVVIDSAGQLGTASSSARFKREIKSMDKASEAVLALKPVTFHYKSDSTNTPQFGLIAEEVAKVNPDLVVRDENGEIYTVRYDQVNAMLLNEFLKEHRKVEQLTKNFESKLAEQQKQIEALTAGLQKVSAQLETSRPAKQVAENSQ